MKVARISTIPEVFVHWRKHNSFLVNEKKISLTYIASDSPYWQHILSTFPYILKCIVPIARNISIIRDLYSLVRLFILFRTMKFDIVHSITPKAGLLVAVAGFLAGVPVRVHTFTGQRWTTISGGKRSLLKSIDRLICFLNTRVYADSPSQRDFLVSEKISQQKKIYVIGNGALGGVDIPKASSNVSPFKVEEECFRFLFVGRLTKEKGIRELVTAFLKIVDKYERPVKLVLVGDYEHELDPVGDDIHVLIESSPSIEQVGFVSNPFPFYFACDVLCLPSYREGFGTVVAEAASCGMPAIGTSIPGLVDAIENGITGELVDKGNVEQLYQSMISFLVDPLKSKTMGKVAMTRVKDRFFWRSIAEAQYQDYRLLLGMREK